MRFGRCVRWPVFWREGEREREGGGYEEVFDIRFFAVAVTALRLRALLICTKPMAQSVMRLVRHASLCHLSMLFRVPNLLAC